MGLFSRQNSGCAGQRGFTLVEVAMALIIGGLILVASVQAYKIEKADKIRQTTVGNLSAIQTALERYANQRGFYPIPAARNLPYETAGAGLAFVGVIPVCNVANATICRSGTAPNSSVLIGAVPYAEIGLPKQYSLDGQTNKFLYAITERLTIAPFNPNNGIIRVRDSTGAIAFTSQQYFVVSAGADRKGAFTASGTQTVPCPAVAAQFDDTNCNNDGEFRDNQINDATGNSHFDDYTITNIALGGIWQRTIGQSDIFATTGKIRIGTVGNPNSKIEIMPSAAYPGNIKTDDFIANRLCNYNEVAGCVAVGSGTLSPNASGITYNPNVFRPGVIADNQNANNTNRAGGGINCGTNALGGIQNANEFCAPLPPTINAATLGTCTGNTAPRGIRANGSLDCQGP